MARIITFPASGCAHFILGRCLYEEHLNPGYQAGYRCLALERLQKGYDSFLNQVDAFGLDDARASGLWEKRFLELCREDTGCQDHEPDDRKDFPGCRHSLEDICVLRLPACAGRCRNYTPKPRE